MPMGRSPHRGVSGSPSTGSSRTPAPPDHWQNRSVVSQPRTRYARAGAVSIAYQVVGEGPFDVVIVPGFISHVELIWEMPAAVHVIQRVSSFARVILFD